MAIADKKNYIEKLADEAAGRNYLKTLYKINKHQNINNKLDVFQNRCLRRILHILLSIYIGQIRSPMKNSTKEKKPDPSPHKLKEDVDDG
jgi:hypothetical protein